MENKKRMYYHTKTVIMNIIKLKIFSLLLLLILITISCNSSCDEQDFNFSSYKEAISTIRSLDFEVEEQVATESSWIETLEYYSCDGKTGFLIMTTVKGKSYIHKNVPIDLWKGISNANSKGKFYNSKFKGKYHLKI